ncbi:hypothetical protein KFE98_03205 [bacterium SCSIO 12741]|nr:hypothetical protein KFE98_03205 [bacterium SCSIO 12741]
MKKLVVLLLAPVILGSCFSAKVFTPTQADVDRIASSNPGTTLEDLKKGMSLYQANCGKCHALKKPSARSAEQWNEIVPRMSKKVNKKEEKLTAADQELVTRYLVTMCQVSK